MHRKQRIGAVAPTIALVVGRVHVRQQDGRLLAGRHRERADMCARCNEDPARAGQANSRPDRRPRPVAPEPAGPGRETPPIGKARNSRTRLRLWRESSRSRMTSVNPLSRSLRATRRCSACKSVGRVSASTGSAQPSATTTASQPRRSRRSGIGTSVRRRRDGCRWPLKRSRSCACARSRIGCPDGYARAESSRPTTASRTERWRTLSSVTRPRSILLTCAADSPTALPTSCWLRPRSVRARRTSAQRSAITCRARSAPMSAGRWRTAMARW